MEDIIKLAGQPESVIISWAISAISLLLAAVMGLLQVKSYLAQSRLSHGYEHLLREAQRDWQGKYTEQQVRELSAQFARLEQQIRHDIPIQARQVFLQDQCHTLSDSIGDLYGQYCDAQSRLGEIQAGDGLPPALCKAIEQHIKPHYMDRLRQQRIGNYILAAVLVLVLLPMLYGFIDMPLHAIGLRVGASDLYAYLAVLVVLLCLAFSMPVDRLESVPAYKYGSKLLAVLSIALGGLQVYSIYYIPHYPAREYQILLCTASYVFLYLVVIRYLVRMLPTPKAFLLIALLVISYAVILFLFTVYGGNAAYVIDPFVSLLSILQLAAGILLLSRKSKGNLLATH